MSPASAHPVATLRYASGSCWLGQVLIAVEGDGLAAILLGDEPAELVAALAARFPGAVLAAAGPVLAPLLASVVALVEAPGQAHHLPLAANGTGFQQQVWHALATIPPGETLDYAGLAVRIGRPGAARAVAAACAANPLAVAIPCHRVVRGTGALAGYAWGIRRKRALLAREAAGLPPPGPLWHRSPSLPDAHPCPTN